MLTPSRALLSKVVSLVVVVALAQPAGAAPGDLDTHFDGDAKRLVHLDGVDTGADVAVMPNGRLLVVGGNALGGDPETFAAARVFPNGAMDTSFSGNGIATYPVGDAFSAARAVVALPNGQALVAGKAYLNPPGFVAFGLIRLLANGDRDMSFGTDGEALLALGADGAFDMALAPGGDIIVAGHADNVSGTDLAVARFDPNGDLDEGFDDDGYAFLDSGSNFDLLSALAVAPDGSMVVVGTDGMTELVAGRFLASGEPDPDFGTGGVLTMDIDDDATTDTVDGVAVEPDGDVVIAGSTAGKAAVLRLNPDGTLDDSFGGGDGLFLFEQEMPSRAFDVKPHHLGTILVGGEATRAGPDLQGLLFRLSANGTLDPGFGGGDGWSTVGFATRSDSLAGIALGPDSIAAAGTSIPGVGTEREMFVARFKDRDPSAVSVTVSKKRRRVTFKGKVTPAHGGQKVRVGYFRKKAGKWRLIARKSSTLNASSSYSTFFKRSKAKRCRVLVEFAGDIHHLGSSKDKRFRC